MIGNAPEHMAQIRFGIHTVELGAPDQTVEDSGTLASAIGTGEEVVAAADGNRTQSSLGGGIMCALIRCIFLPGANPGRQTLAPAGNTRGGSRGDE